MLTVKQAAERLNVSAQLVYALCAGGKIDHVRYGLGRGTIRISEEALTSFHDAARIGQALEDVQQLKHLKPPAPRRT